MENAINNLIQVYNMLEDDQSKDIYLKRLNYVLTGDFQYIRDIVLTWRPDLVPWTSDSMGFRHMLKSLPADRNYVFCGAGAEAVALVDGCKNDKRFVGFCSSTKAKQEKGYLGYPVMSFEELLARKDLNAVITTTRAREEIFQILEAGGYPEDQIFDGPRYYARMCMDREQYFAPEFMKYEDEEVFVDAGCFDLGSSIELRKYCKHVKKVYAFEPDGKNYKVCLRRKQEFHYDEVKLLPFGTWSEKGKLSFLNDLGGSSHICSPGEMGKEVVSVVSIDEIVDPGERVTMIKMDVEGAELESLKGAKKTIQRDKPKLAICVYHKPEDIISIPLYIKEIVPEYKLYMRHHASKEDETVLYAVLS